LWKRRCPLRQVEKRKGRTGGEKNSGNLMAAATAVIAIAAAAVTATAALTSHAAQCAIIKSGTTAVRL
jgi:hypothetical protein